MIPLLIAASIPLIGPCGAIEHDDVGEEDLLTQVHEPLSTAQNA